MHPGKKIVKRERVTFSEKRKGWTVQSTDEIVSLAICSFLPKATHFYSKRRNSIKKSPSDQV